MIKTRSEIKQEARESASHQRGTAILAIVTWFVILFVGSFFNFIPLIGGFITLATVFFIDNPLLVGLQGIFIKIYNNKKANVEDLFTIFSSNYIRKVGGMFLMYLFTTLWTLLLIIPGLIKSYSYAMTPFILAQYPEVGSKEAITLSRKMMNGHKLNLFVFDLSFIGWHILNLFTFGLLGIFWLFPYYFTAYAGMYENIKAAALDNRVIEDYELGNPSEHFQGEPLQSQEADDRYERYDRN